MQPHQNACTQAGEPRASKPHAVHVHVSTRPTERAGWVARAPGGGCHRVAAGRSACRCPGQRVMTRARTWVPLGDNARDGLARRRNVFATCDRPLPRLQSGWRGLHMHAWSDTATRWCPPLSLLVLPWPRAAIRGKLLGQEGREGLQGCHDDQEQGEDRAVRVGPQK